MSWTRSSCPAGPRDPRPGGGPSQPRSPTRSTVSWPSSCRRRRGKKSRLVNLTRNTPKSFIIVMPSAIGPLTRLSAFWQNSNPSSWENVATLWTQSLTKFYQHTLHCAVASIWMSEPALAIIKLYTYSSWELFDIPCARFSSSLTDNWRYRCSIFFINRSQFNFLGQPTGRWRHDFFSLEKNFHPTWLAAKKNLKFQLMVLIWGQTSRHLLNDSFDN